MGKNREIDTAFVSLVQARTCANGFRRSLWNRFLQGTGLIGVRIGRSQQAGPAYATLYECNSDEVC